VPRDRPEPPPFEGAVLERSLNRYLIAGLVFMTVLIAAFVGYRVREPSLRADATRAQEVSYRKLGRSLFSDNCAECHGDAGTGGGDAPTLNSKQFLSNTSDAQIHSLVSGGVSGTEMSAWGLEFGGTLTDEQITQIVVYLRSLEHGAPSIPDWRSGTQAGG
jgi:mono/diheme cytochrome c family protein